MKRLLSVLILCFSFLIFPAVMAGCEEYDIEPLEVRISNSVVNENGDFYLEVDPNKETLELDKYFKVNKQSLWEVYLDENHTSLIQNDNTELNFGENNFWILIKNNNRAKGYKLTIFRNYFEYSIMYELNGGQIDTYNVKNYRYDMGTIVLANPYKYGFEFVGWFDGSNKKYICLDKDVKCDLNLYAKFEPIQYKIHYFLKSVSDNLCQEFADSNRLWNENFGWTILNNPNQDTFTITDQDFDLKPLSIKHFNFLGWYEDEACTRGIEKIEIDTEKKYQIYAKVEPLEYEVELYVNNKLQGQINVKYGEKLSNFPVMQVSPGYGLSGWECEVGGKKVAIKSGMVWEYPSVTKIFSKELSIFKFWDGYLTKNKNRITGLTDFGKTLNFIEIPEEIDGEKVLYINNLGKSENLVRIIIPRSVIEVSESWYDGGYDGCPCLTEIVDYSFLGLSEIKSVEQSKIEIIDGNIYHRNGSNLTLVKYINKNKNIDENTTIIGRCAFAWSDIEEINFPEKVEEIETGAFYKCYKLKRVTIPNSLKKIEIIKAFEECDNIEYIKMPYVEQFYSNEKFINAKSVDLCFSANNIGSSFSGCTKIKSISILNEINSIGERAFSGCINLSYIVVTQSIMNIGNSAFRQCASLKDVYYLGNQEEFANISVGENNEYFTTSTIYFYIENIEDLPSDGGNYWHYDGAGNPTKW